MKAFFAAAATLLHVSVSPPFILEDGERMDFWNWPAFEAHYAYLDTAPSEVAQPVIWIDGSRQANGTFRLQLTGIDPTAAFPHNFCRREIVATLDGKVLTGLVRSESDEAIELVDSETKWTRIMKSEIDERRVGNLSVMPNRLVESLSPSEFSDLIAYLMSLKQVESRAASARPAP